MIKKKNFKHIEKGDTYKFILNNYHIVDNNKLVDVIQHYYGFPLKTSMKQVDDLITIKPYMDETLASNWINNAKILRSDKTTSITSLCYLGEGQLYSTLQSIGLPLVLDNGDARSSNSNSNAKSLFLYPVMLTFLNSLLNEGHNTSCKLSEYCTKNTDTMNYNELCDTSPWNKEIDIKMCPFLDVKRMWGFENKYLAVK